MQEDTRYTIKLRRKPPRFAEVPQLSENPTAAEVKARLKVMESNGDRVVQWWQHQVIALLLIKDKGKPGQVFHIADGAYMRSEDVQWFKDHLHPNDAKVYTPIADDRVPEGHVYIDVPRFIVEMPLMYARTEEAENYQLELGLVKGEDGGEEC